MRYPSCAGLLPFLFVLSSLTIGASSLAQGLPAVAPVSSPQPLGLQEQLKAALEKELGKLGELTPWQTELFQQEVLASHQRFIKDYRSSGTGVTIDADLVNLKNYLRFHASQLPGADQAVQNFYVALLPQANCAKCVAAEPAIRAQIQQRMERRGFKVLWIAQDELKAVQASLNPEDRVFQDMKEKAGAGALVVRWGPSLSGEEDTLHGDGPRFKMVVTLAVREIGRHSTDLEILESANFENTFVRLMTDSFAAIGARQLQLGFLTSGGNQVFVELTGVTDYASYRALVRLFQEKLGPAEPLVERKVSRGAVTLALKTMRDKNEIKKLLATVPASALKWEVK